MNDKSSCYFKSKGVFTSEFWVAIAVLIGSLLFVFNGQVEFSQWMEFTKWIVITYLGSRAALKAVNSYTNEVGKKER